MDSLKDKRACTSCRIMVSVKQVEYCEAKIALERDTPEWLLPVCDLISYVSRCNAHNNDEVLGWYVPSHGDIFIEVAGY